VVVEVAVEVVGLDYMLLGYILNQVLAKIHQPLYIVKLTIPLRTQYQNNTLLLVVQPYDK
jgi:hypothetical protein